jgi:anti-sigma factor RsiW
VTRRRGAHVEDDRLVEVCVDRAATPAEDVHFARCDECAARRARLDALLREMSDAAAAEADAAFPAERLALQHARILQRIEQDGRPARVIAFPAAQASELRPLRARPAARWIAGAAAAGLAVGLLAGHLAHDLPTLVRPARPAAVRPTASRPVAQPERPVNVSLNDEEFLGEIENALNGPRLTVLRPLNDLTPQ